jgi:hypothetical protein
MDMGIYMDMKCTILRFYINTEELLELNGNMRRKLKTKWRERFMFVFASFFKVHELR